MELTPYQWDWQLTVFLNNLSPEALDPFWSTITYSKYWIPFYIVLVALFFYKSELKKSIIKVFFLLLCVGMTHLVTEVTKSAVQRLRPNVTPEIMDSLKVLYEPSNFSFFSGHASTSFAATVFIYLLLKSKFNHIGLIFIWAILFSLSRIFVGVHFVSDVIVGAFVGAIIAILFYKFDSYFENRLLSISNQNYT